MKSKKILFVVNVDWFFISHRLPIALKALEEGYEVHLACSFSDGRPKIEKLGIKCHDIHFSRSGKSIIGEIFTLFSLRKIIKELNVDVVHSITIKPVIYTGLILKTIFYSPSFVVAISGLGYVFSADNFKAKVTKSLVKLMYKISLSIKNKKVIFQNESDLFVLSNIVKLYEHEKVLIKGSGVDLDFYKHSSESDIDFKVVMASRLLKEKGVYQYIEAAKNVREKYPDVEFLLVGSPDSENPHSITQSELNVWMNQGVINYLGHKNDIPSIFASANIVCLPSYYGEGVPKVLIEAAACGRAIVTTDKPGCRDAIIDGKTGLLVPARDSNSLAESISFLIQNPNLRVSMGNEARLYAEAEFDINSVVDKHLKIYSSLLRG